MELGIHVIGDPFYECCTVQPHRLHTETLRTTANTWRHIEPFRCQDDSKFGSARCKDDTNHSARAQAQRSSKMTQKNTHMESHARHPTNPRSSPRSSRPDHGRRRPPQKNLIFRLSHHVFDLVLNLNRTMCRSTGTNLKSRGESGLFTSVGNVVMGPAEKSEDRPGRHCSKMMRTVRCWACASGACGRQRVTEGPRTHHHCSVRESESCQTIAPHSVGQMDTVFANVRQKLGRPKEDKMDQIKTNVTIWGLFMNASWNAVSHLGKDHDEHLRVTRNTEFCEIQPLFSITQKLVLDQEDEIFGVFTIYWDRTPWIESTLVHESATKLSTAKIYVYSDWVVNFGGKNRIISTICKICYMYRHSDSQL